MLDDSDKKKLDEIADKIMQCEHEMLKNQIWLSVVTVVSKLMYYAILIVELFLFVKMAISVIDGTDSYIRSHPWIFLIFLGMHFVNMFAEKLAKMNISKNIKQISEELHNINDNKLQQIKDDE